MAQINLNSKGSPNKTAFVLSLPRSLSAAEVVERAQAAGIELSTVRVHKIRAKQKAKERAQKPKERARKPAVAGAKSSAAKAQRTAPSHGNKSAFVRALAPDIPASEVVRRAQAEGMKLSIGQVYNIRSVARKSGTIGKSAAPRGPGRPPAAASTASSTTRPASNVDTVLRGLIAQVGLARAREVMNEVQAAFR